MTGFRIPTEHHCHAIGCEVAVHPRMLMCHKHWRMVPANLQKLVWQVYKPGQEVTKKPSAAYMIVQGFAVEAVATQENRWNEVQAVTFLNARIARFYEHVPEQMRTTLLRPLFNRMLERVRAVGHANGVL